MKSNGTELNFHLKKQKIITTNLFVKNTAIDDMHIAERKDDRNYGRGVGRGEQMGREEKSLTLS